jgi:hypothetical protein
MNLVKKYCNHRALEPKQKNTINKNPGFEISFPEFYDDDD